MGPTEATFLSPLPFCLKQLSIHSIGPGLGPYLHIQIREAEQGDQIHLSFSDRLAAGKSALNFAYTGSCSRVKSAGRYVGESYREATCQISVLNGGYPFQR